MEIAQALNEVLSEQWSEKRGIAVASFGVNSVAASPEDEQMIKRFAAQRGHARPVDGGGDARRRAGGGAQKGAASNENGAMMGFMGLGMAQQAGGMNAQDLFRMGAQQQQAKAQPADGWVCPCGAQSAGKVLRRMRREAPRGPASAGAARAARSTRGKFCPGMRREEARGREGV